MLTQALKAIIYVIIVLSLFLIDNILGNGFVDIFRKMYCKLACFVKRSIRVDMNQVAVFSENLISFPLFYGEIIILSLLIAVFNKYKKCRGLDRLDELLHESKETLRLTNEFLDKWRLKRINRQVSTEFSYVDNDEQEIKPHKIEVPILCMAIIDTLATRNQPESGDAGDAINITDSTLLSATSLIDEDSESITEQPIDQVGERIGFKNRVLWDIMQQDTNII